LQGGGGEWEGRSRATIREPGYLAIPGPFHSVIRRECTPTGGPVLPYVPLRFLLSLSLALATGADAVTGVVTDDSGRAVPRAHVRLVVDDTAAAESTFTDADGTFRLPAVAGRCQVEASLEGFTTATAPCRGDEPLRLTLTVAPVAEHVIVSATRTDAPASQVAASVTVFDADDLEQRQMPLLGDLLRTAPGATVVRSGAPGGVTSLFVRGGESNYTKVLLDGIPLNEPGGTFDLNDVSTENLERVEFVRGANSALFGSDAMTGVIQLFTRRGKTARPLWTGRAEAGGFGTSRVSGGVSGAASGLDYSADAAHFSTDNQVPNSALRTTTASGTIGTRLSTGTRLRLVGRFEDGRNGVPGQAAFGRPDLDATFRRRDGAVGATLDQSAGRWHQRASYGLSISHQASANRVIDPPYTPSFEGHVAPFEFSDYPYDSFNRLSRHHATYQGDVTTGAGRAGTHVDTALVDWDGERGTLEDRMAGTSTTAARDNVGVSVQHQALWPRAFVTAGIRIERNASFGTTLVPRVAGTYVLRTSAGALGTTRVNASAGRGIKEPTLLQSFSRSPLFLGNPDLRPERARTLEVSLEQRLAADRVRVTLAWFANRYRDIISTRTTSFDPYESQYFNIGLTRARGVELSGDVALVSGLRARAGYTLLDSRILESTSEFSEVLKAGNAAFRRPRHSGYVQLRWLGARGSAGVTGTIAGQRVDSDFSSLEPPLTMSDGYQQWDLDASGRLTKRLSLTLTIDNLADRRYMEPLGYPALGRTARVGLRAAF
jgi:outer membrane cobalamin receptor